MRELSGCSNEAESCSGWPWPCSIIEHMRRHQRSYGRHTAIDFCSVWRTRLKALSRPRSSLRISAWELCLHSALPENHGGEDPRIAPGVYRVLTGPSMWTHTEIVGRSKAVMHVPEDGKEPNGGSRSRSGAQAAKSSGEQYLHHRIENNSELARRVGMAPAGAHRTRASSCPLYPPKLR